ncbi:hypothetical protein D3C81_1731920 [compost metagenome]
MHVDAEGTAVDLRGTQLDQFDQVLFQRQLGDSGLQGNHGFEGVRAGGVKIETRLHGVFQGKWVWNYVSTGKDLYK